MEWIQKHNQLAKTEKPNKSSLGVKSEAHIKEKTSQLIACRTCPYELNKKVEEKQEIHRQQILILSKILIALHCNKHIQMPKDKMILFRSLEGQYPRLILMPTTHFDEQHYVMKKGDIVFCGFI